MYRGVRLDHVSVNDYSTALDALAERGKRGGKVKQAERVVPGGTEAPLGHPRSEVTGIRMDANESIRMRLYRTDVVVYHKDGSIDIDSYPSNTTTAFANMLLPAGMSLGHTHMTLFPQTGDWRSSWAAARVCRADGRYVETDWGWMPEDPVALKKLTLDRKKSRALSKRFHLADFTNWLFMITRHTQLVHRAVDTDMCMDMLEERDFKSAAMHLPTITVPRGFGAADRIKPLPFVGTHRSEPITMGSVGKIRQVIYADHGALDVVEEPWLPLSVFDKQKQLSKQLEDLGCYV